MEKNANCLCCDQTVDICSFLFLLTRAEKPRYHISTVIRRSFFSFQNNPKDLDPSSKMNLDPCDCLGRVKLVL